VEPPNRIEEFTVVEFGFFPLPILPAGYVPSADGTPPLELVQNLAICTAAGIDGFYLLFCTPEWRYVTSCFNNTIEYTKQIPSAEFGSDVAEWHRLGD
jgi:hypothetical protein